MLNVEEITRYSESKSPYIPLCKGGLGGFPYAVAPPTLFRYLFETQHQGRSGLAYRVKYLQFPHQVGNLIPGLILDEDSFLPALQLGFVLDLSWV